MALFINLNHADFDPFAYDDPFRPNYEQRIVIIWLACAISIFCYARYHSLPAIPTLLMISIAITLAVIYAVPAYRLYIIQKSLSGKSLSFITIKQLDKKIKANCDTQWLGFGFIWENKHAQRAFELLKKNYATLTRKTKVNKDIKIGLKWIHGLESNEEQLYQPLLHADSHTLIVGTTGAGKTRLFDILISQAILRNEAVIIIDPKGDKELASNAKYACQATGRIKDYVHFHPAFPHKSVQINPLQNYSKVTEIASRLAALIPGESNTDPFKSFGWQALNNIAQGLIIIDQHPTLVSLRKYLEGGSRGLVTQAIAAYAHNNLKDEYQSLYEKFFSSKHGKNETELMINFYYSCVQNQYPSSELEGLISMYKHDSTHFAKMVASLLPIMNMLTSGELANLLSPPKVSEATIAGKVFPDGSYSGAIDTTTIINSKKVAYIGLDSLSDSLVGSAIGSLFLADLAAVAGSIYNFSKEDKPINIFVDEAAEVINDPFIQLLNKGRGAGIRLYVNSQTFADFSARTGSKDKALQILGNVNNLIALRIEDTETQQYITDKFPKTRLKYVMRTQGQSTDTDSPVLHGGSQGERLIEEEAELFATQLLGMLPNLEYVAKISGGTIIKGRIPILVKQPVTNNAPVKPIFSKTDKTKGVV